jgi:predicted transcriptional regulator
LKLYELKIHRRDDYFYSHDTFSVKIIDVIETIKCEYSYKENKKVVRSNTFLKYKIKNEENGDSIETIDVTDGTYFKTLEKLLEYFKKEYFKVHSDKYYDYYMDTDNKDSITCVSNLSNRGLGLAAGYIDLQKELKENK